MSQGEYYVDIILGTNASPLSVQVDTGSSTLIVPDARCLSCSKPHGGYKSTSTVKIGLSPLFFCPLPISSMSKRYNNMWVYYFLFFLFCKGCGSEHCMPNTCDMCGISDEDRGTCNGDKCCSAEDASSCGFYLVYGDQDTAEGSLVQDTITLGGMSHSVVFGSILRETGNGWDLSNSVDGILGLAYKSLDCNPTCTLPVMDVFAQQGMQNVFSMCMSDFDGYLVMGGSDPSLHHGDFRYVPLTGQIQPSYYGLDFFDMRVNGETVFASQGLKTGQTDNLDVAGKFLYQRVVPHCVSSPNNSSVNAILSY
jgi:hypothetical protein